MIDLDARPYGSDCTAEERAAIAARVWIHDGILFQRGMPVASVYSVDVMFDAADALVAGVDSFAFVVDLTECARPSAEVRERLRARMGRLVGKLRHVALLVGGNFMMRLAAKFVLSWMGFESFSVHERREQAIEAARRAR